jgi:hypothetical protein
MKNVAKSKQKQKLMSDMATLTHSCLRCLLPPASCKLAAQVQHGTEAASALPQRLCDRSYAIFRYVDMPYTRCPVLL